MREIKFRVWTGMGMEYRILAGLLGAFYAPELDPQDSACICKNNTIYPKECPVMQYTGLKDKNGKEIYEGDILKSTRKQGEKTLVGKPPKKKIHAFGKTTVLWKDGCWRLKKSRRSISDILTSLINRFLKLEIIGNIYSNPELLNQSTQ